MRVLFYFTKPTGEVPVNNQDKMNSYIHSCLGSNNKYHDTFSDYSISSLQGGRLTDKGTLSFENSEPYIVVSTLNEKFLNDIMLGIMASQKEVMTMKFDHCEVADFKPHKFFDKVISISPILLKDKNDKKIVYQDAGWLERLNEQSIAKLGHMDIIDPTFKIEFSGDQKRAKKKLVYVGTVSNPCSSVRLKVSGTKEARTAIYNLGLGNSTGCGFGAVKLYE